MKKLITLLVGLGILLPAFLFAAPNFTPLRTILPEENNLYNLGSDALRWATGFFEEICLAGDCRTTWGGSGGGSAAGSAGAVQYSDGSGGFLATSSLKWDDSVGQLNVGTTSPIYTGNINEPILAVSDIDDYSAIAVQNLSPLGVSSFIAYADNDDGEVLTGKYIEVTMTGSNYDGGDLVGANYGALGVNGGNLVISTFSTDNHIDFTTGGDSFENRRVRIQDDRTIFFANYEADIAKDVASSTLWTGNNGWSVSGGLVKVTGSATGIIYPTASTTITAGTKYKVTVTATSTTGVPTYTLGGVAGSNIADGTFTDYIEAVDTSDIIFSGSSTTATTITALEILPLTDATGDAFVEGDLKVGGSITTNNDDTIFNISGEGIVTFPNIPLLPATLPTSDLHATSKVYVDSLLTTGARFVSAVRAATTAALPAVTYNNGASGVGATLTANANGALSAQDGVTLTAGQMLLVKNQVATSTNGVYNVTTVGDGSNPFVLTRITSYDQSAEITAGTFFTVLEGTENGSEQWAMNNDTTITVGTTDITFSQLSQPIEYTSANNGISILGTVITLALSATNPALEIVADGLRVLVDDSTIQRTSLGLAVKDAGITAAKLATGAVDLASGTVTGILGATKGGTGQSTVTTGDILYGSAANTWSKLAGVATGNALISGGVGVAPSWGKIGLTTHVSGTLARANGGTGVTTSPDDNILIGNGTLFQLKSLVDCSDSNEALTYNITTNAVGCNTITGTGGNTSGASNAFNLQYTKTLDVSSSTVAVSNTAAATTVYSYSVPANTLGTDKGLRLNLSGTYLNNSGANRTVTITATYGGTTILSQATPAIVTSATTGNWGVNIYLMAANATNAQRARLDGSFEAGTAADVVINDNGSSAVDSTVNQSLIVTVTNSAAATTIVTTKNLAVLEQLNASESIGGSNWVASSTYSNSVITPTTTVGIWAKGGLFASSTSFFSGLGTWLNGLAVSGATSTFSGVEVNNGTQIKFAGYSSNPQIVSADNQTGMHFDGPGIISLHNSGTQSLLINGLNNVGIASSSPSSRLSVAGVALFQDNVTSSTAPTQIKLHSYDFLGGLVQGSIIEGIASNGVNGLGTVREFSIFGGDSFNPVISLSSRNLLQNANIGYATTTDIMSFNNALGGYVFNTEANSNTSLTVDMLDLSGSLLTDLKVPTIFGSTLSSTIGALTTVGINNNLLILEDSSLNANPALSFGAADFGDAGNSGAITYATSTGEFNIDKKIVIQDTNNDPRITFSTDDASTSSEMYLNNEDSFFFTGASGGYFHDAAIAVVNDDQSNVVLASANGVNLSAISYSSSTDVMSFIQASGGYEFDNLAPVGADPLCWDGSGGSLIGDCSSLAKYKTNQKSFASGLADVLKLDPKTFDWKRNADGSLSDTDQYDHVNPDTGFIAEEVALVNPNFGRYNEQGELQDVNERGIIGAIINAIKEMFSWLQMQHAWNNSQDKEIELIKTEVCAKDNTYSFCK